MSGIFENVLKSGNKSGNSILRTFSDSGLDVKGGCAMADKTVKDGWSMLMKFGSEENLQKLQAGQLYMKNLKYYVDLEKETEDEAVGDM